MADDVDMVANGYRYQESNDKFRLRIAGSKSARRGRPILGLRSNVAKAIFFEEVQGEMKTARVSLKFSAKDGEWSGDVSQPFLLKTATTLVLNGKEVAHGQRARIYFKQMVVEVAGKNREVYKL